MSRVPLTQLIPRLVDKWSFEFLHRAKMGETQAMVQVAQIQFSRHGWGRIKPDAVQGRRWLEYSASRGDAVAAASLTNLRMMLAAREKDLLIAKEAGIIDLARRGADGKSIPVSEQAKLPPLNFSRLISNKPSNHIEATSEEEAISSFIKKEYRPIQDTIAEHKRKHLQHAKAELQQAAAAVKGGKE